MKLCKTISNVMAVMAIATVMAACNQNSKEAAPQANTTPSAEKNSGLKIAFVQLDTLTNQYKYYQDVNDEFKKKQANAEATVNQKGKSFANQAQEFQRKAQSNQYTQEQFNNEQARLAKLQQDIQDLSTRLSVSLQEEQAKELQALTDTIQHFAESYAKEKGYDFILCKSSQIDNVLYASKAHDITDEVVKALNKRYDKSAKKSAAKETKKTETKK